MYLCSRTSVEIFQECPRKRWWYSFYNGTGIVAARPAVALSTGVAEHVGVAALLRGAPPKDAITEMRNAYAQSWGDINALGPNDLYHFYEQQALIIALLYAFCKRVLPEMLSRYEVLWVEQWMEHRLSDVVTFRGIPDAVLREKSTGDIYVFSLKTTARVDQGMPKRLAVDIQVMGEMWLTDRFLESYKTELRNVANTWANLRPIVACEPPDTTPVARYAAFVHSLPDRVSGVKLVYLVKGERREVKDVNGQGTGRYVTESPLVKGYFNPESNEYAYSYYVPKAENKSGRGTISRGFAPFNAWEIGPGPGLIPWLQMLDAQQVQPELGDPLARVVYAPMDLYRNQADIQDWLEQVNGQETQVGLGAEMCLENPGSSRHLNSYFPQHRQSCFSWGHPCDYWDACHTAGIKENPLSGGLYKIKEGRKEGNPI